VTPADIEKFTVRLSSSPWFYNFLPGSATLKKAEKRERKKENPHLKNLY